MKLKIVENEHQEKSYEYDEEILKFINNLPVEGKELVLNRFASGYDDYYFHTPNLLYEYQLVHLHQIHANI